MNRRSEKLDKYLNKLVQITFNDGEIATGYLKFGRSFWGLPSSSNEYSISYNGTDYYFRKSHVKKVVVL